MTAAWIVPSRLDGSVRAPSSKSYTHRAAIAAFLSGRRARVVHPLRSEDTRVTVDGLRALGAGIAEHQDRWVFAAGEVPNRLVRIDASSSGTSLRFLAPLAAQSGHPVLFSGSQRLAQRPLRPLLRSLVARGARVRFPPGNSSLPVRIQGPIHPGLFRIPGDESSQFLSALLLALPTLAAGSEVRVDSRLVSSWYVKATLAVLARHGVRVRHRGARWTVPAPQQYSGRPLTVPGDASSAAFLWAGAALTGGTVTTRNLDPAWPQADFALLPILAKMGGSVVQRGDEVQVAGRARQPFSADLRDAPDLVPVAAVLAAMIPRGRSRLWFAPALRTKESDRIRETQGLVQALGAQVTSGSGTLAISPGALPPALRWNPPDDHRMVMAGAVAALGLSRPSRLARADRVSKSFPEFWSVLSKLGAEVRP